MKDAKRASKRGIGPAVKAAEIKENHVAMIWRHSSTMLVGSTS